MFSKNSNSNYLKGKENYFNPKSISDFLVVGDIEKILLGEVLNPHKLKDSKNMANYSYFVAGNCIFGDSDEIYKRKVGDGGDKLLNSLKWFGYFSVEGESSIFLPYQKELIFNPQRETSLLIDRKGDVFGKGDLHYDKIDDDLILASLVSLGSLNDLVNEIYGRDLL